ncbi:MAG: ArnT family glycosyltransferase, partial [Candidatus Promineifilaceae bacterium]
WVTIGLLLTAAFLRIGNLRGVPPGIVRDEALNFDIARRIRDGQHRFFFREGFGHEPLYHYFAAPFEPLIGPNLLAVRLPSIILSVLLIAALAAVGARLFNRSTGVLAAAFAAVSWWVIIFGRIGLRPILLPLILLFALATWHKRPWLAGIFLGLLFYTYTASRVFVLLIPLDFAISALAHPRTFRNSFKRAAAAIAVALPLVITLLRDPSLDQRVQQLAGPLAALQTGDITPLLTNLLRTLGAFGFTPDPNPSYVLTTAPLVPPLIGLCIYAALGWAIWQSRVVFFKQANNNAQRDRALTLLLLLGSWGIGLLPTVLADEAPSAIRLIGTVPATFLLLGYFLTSAFGRIPNPLPRVALPIILLLLTLNTTLSQGFQQWVALPKTQQKYQTIFSDIARYWDSSAQKQIVVADGWYEPVKKDSLLLQIGQDTPIRWVQSHHALVLPATATDLYVPEYAVPIGPLSQKVQLNENSLRYRSTAAPSFAVYKLPTELPLTPFPAPYLFVSADNQPQITLAATEVTNDGTGLITAWEVQTPLASDLAIFVHVIDKAGTIIAQHDGLDAVAASLITGDRILQYHPLQVADWQTVDLRIGLYQRDTGQRYLVDGVDFVQIAPPAAK